MIRTRDRGVATYCLSSWLQAQIINQSATTITFGCIIIVLQYVMVRIVFFLHKLVDLIREVDLILASWIYHTEGLPSCRFDRPFSYSDAGTYDWN